MNNIPKIIHQIQEETQPLFSDFFSNLSQSWVENHPLWQYKLWSLHDIKELIHCEFPHFATFCDNNLNNKLLLEISRYFILYREGGIFVDSISENKPNKKSKFSNITLSRSEKLKTGCFLA